MRPVFVTMLLPLLIVACRGGSSAPADTLVVSEAASLSTPFRAILDTFARRTGAVVQVENGASLELARRITDLHRVPDVIALADEEVFPERLVPAHVRWYARFARNRMVIAWTDRSRHAEDMDSTRWREILLSGDVIVGRPDPRVAPAGYRALLMYELAEQYYGEPELAARLAARTPPGNVRGSATELAALLAAGEMDYIVEYESVARAQGFRFLSLPAAIDLGDPGRGAEYARAVVRVGRSDSASGVGTDSISERRGAPILYGVGVPNAARHPEMGRRFIALVLSEEGRRMLRAAKVDALAVPEIVGDSTSRAP